MKLRIILMFVFLGTLLAGFGYGQSPKKTAPDENLKVIKSSPAYAEVLLRKAELEAEVESLLETYTEDYPKLRESRFELDLIAQDLTKLLAQTDPSRLTLALGKLLVRKNQLETDLWVLQNQYGKDHPEVKRAQRKVASFQKSIKEILP
jgi:uncharacterized protein involved in exopolysaccharide biosynthesis